MGDEARARNLSRAQNVQDRAAGAVGVLEAEDAVREAAREEDQTAGPWGFEMDTTRDSGGKAEGSGKEGVRQVIRGGTRDGLGVFGVSVEDGDFYGHSGGGKKAGVDDAEIQLFQPLQQAAHEER